MGDGNIMWGRHRQMGFKAGRVGSWGGGGTGAAPRSASIIGLVFLYDWTIYAGYIQLYKFGGLNTGTHLLELPFTAARNDSRHP